MLPRCAMNYSPNRLLGNAIIRCKSGEWVACRVSGADDWYVVGPELRAGVPLTPASGLRFGVSATAKAAGLEPGPRCVRLVFGNGRPLQILDSVVGLDSVDVVDAGLGLGRLSEEGAGDEPMHRAVESVSSSCAAKPNGSVPLAQATDGQLASERADAVDVATNSSQVRYGVIRKLLNHAPLFALKFFGCKVRTSHDAFTSLVKLIGQGRSERLHARSAHLFYHETLGFWAF